MILLRNIGSNVSVSELVDRSRLSLYRGRDGRLHALQEGSDVAVSVGRCFPWSQPNRFLSLRDDAGNEVALIEDAAILDDGSRRALEEELEVTTFRLIVTTVNAVREEIEMRSWEVGTEQGPRTFQTARDEWPREIVGGGIVIKDVAGDLYEVPDPRALDTRSQKLLWAFVD